MDVCTLQCCCLGHAECSSAHYCEGLGKHAHFRNFGMAFLTLFRVATGDNWNGIMKVWNLNQLSFGFITTLYMFFFYPLYLLKRKKNDVLGFVFSGYNRNEKKQFGSG